jgi:putative membrane protein
MYSGREFWRISDVFRIKIVLIDSSGWGGMWLGPLFMILWLALLVAVIVLLVRWLPGGSGMRGRSPRTSLDILDERYARGEIVEKNLQRKKDIAST